MKIAFVVGDISSTGGIERAMSRVTEILTKSGYNITIISLFKAHHELAYKFNPDIKLIFLSDKKYATIKQGSFKRLSMFIKVFFKCRKYFKSVKKDYDVFIGCGFPISLILYLVGLKNKSIGTEHTFHAYYPSYINILRKHIYRKFPIITSLTRKDTLQFRNEQINCITIPNPLSFECDRVSDLSSKRIIAVGRLSPEKGFEDLIKIMPHIKEKFPDWRLDIYGEGYLRSSLQKLIEEQKVEDKVKLCGNSTNIKQEYLNSSMFVLTSRFEGFAIVLLEAASCGLPIISYNCPNGPSEIIGDNKGILLPPNDINALQDSILSLIENPDLMKQYSKKRNEILAPFRDDMILKYWVNLLQEFRRRTQ